MCVSIRLVELLNKTDDKTYVIAAKVGYQEQNYSATYLRKIRRFTDEIQRKPVVGPAGERGMKPENEAAFSNGPASAI